MRFSTALSVISLCGGALASPSNYLLAEAAPPVHAAMAAAPVEHVAPPSHVVAAPPMHEVAAAAPVHETIAAAAPPMVHSTVAAVAPPAMVHSTVAAAAPPAHTVAPPVHSTVAAAAPVHTTAAAHEMAAAAAATHTVIAGGEGIIYDPPFVHAAIGDVVHVVFLAKNHTLTQSTFAEPCVLNPAGLNSGFLPNELTTLTADAPSFEVPVTSLDPSWWYCAQGEHCKGGMVFAINPTVEKTFEVFQAAAMVQGKAGLAGAGGNATATAPAAAGSAGVTLSVDNSGLAPLPEKTQAAAVAPPAGSMVAGWNQGAQADACNCACFCGAAQFPAGDGVGAYGGYSGSLPAPWG